MQINSVRLTATERRRRLTQGLCLYLITTCPTPPPRHEFCPARCAILQFLANSIWVFSSPTPTSRSPYLSAFSLSLLRFLFLC